MQTATPEREAGPARRRRRWAFIAAPLVVLLIVGFLLFRPDKLVVDDRADENLADAFTPATEVATTVAAGAAAASTAPAGTAAPVATATVATATESTPAARVPVLTLHGQFESLAHEGAGTVGVYEQDGQIVLRFEDDTAVENGPDLNVYMLPTETWTGSVDGFVDLGDLKGNVGGQNYDIPAGTDLTTHRTVIVWCVRFGVGFAAASLTAPA